MQGGITGGAVANLGGAMSGWMISLLVVVFGIVLYFVLAELFEW
jgi:hypothetical protein